MLLGKAAQVKHLEGLSAQITKEFDSETKPKWRVSPDLMEIMDKAFVLMLEPDFGRLFGAPVGSARHIEWQTKLKQYTGAIIEGLQANNLPDNAKMVAKRLFYVVHTPLG